MASTDVIVIGGGAIGTAVAYYLAKQGASVEVLERDRVGSGATFASAGLLTPLSERPAPPLLALCMEGRRLLDAAHGEIEDDAGVQMGYQSLDILVLDPPAEGEWGKDGVSLITQEELRKLEPGSGWKTSHGALYLRKQAQVSAPQLARTFALAAAHRGATITEGCAAEGLELQGRRAVRVRTSQGEHAAGAVVLAAGAWSGPFSRWTGFPLPVHPARGQSALVSHPGVRIRHCLVRDGCYLVPKAEGLSLIGTTLEPEAGFDARVTAGGLSHILSGVLKLAPAVASATFVEARAGLRPASGDELPVLGQVPSLDNVYIASGHYRNGILLSAITGKLMAEQVLHRKQPDLLKPFDPARFAKSGVHPLPTREGERTDKAS